MKTRASIFLALLFTARTHAAELPDLALQPLPVYNTGGWFDFFPRMER